MSAGNERSAESRVAGGSGPGRVGAYRFRATFRRRWPGYLTIVLLVGLLGGLAIGVLAGARRTQSSFSAFWRSTNPSEVGLSGVGIGTDSPIYTSLAGLKHVQHVDAFAALVAGPLQPDGRPIPAALSQELITGGGVDGYGESFDRFVVLHGRRAVAADEVTVTTAAATLLHLRIGSTTTIGFFSMKQVPRLQAGVKVPPQATLAVHIVGVVVPNDEIVQDDVDAQQGLPLLILSPAATETYRHGRDLGGGTGLHLDSSPNVATTVDNELEQKLGPNGAFYLDDPPVHEAQAERAIKPEAIALGVFGLIATVAALLIVGQVIGRQLRQRRDELSSLRAAGASPAMTTLDGLIGIIGAIGLGSLFAVLVAAALSPVFPLGPARRVYPTSGVAFDWTVMAAGFALFTLVLSVYAFALAFRLAPHRVARREQRGGPRRASLLARPSAGSALPAPAATGLRLALEPDAETTSIRSASLGATLAIIVVTATLAFGASLQTLVSHPALYGWKWDDELVSQGGGGNIDAAKADQLFTQDPDVAATTGVYFDSLHINDLTVPLLGVQPNPVVAPPLLSGHTVEAPDQIVVGQTTLAQLHGKVGDRVRASYGGDPHTTSVRIVGTAAMPAVGPAHEAHLSIGVGVMAYYKFIPSDVLGTGFQPNAIFIRLRPHADRAAALARLDQIALAVHHPDQGPLSVNAVQRPAEIVNYKTMGNTPALLGGALAVGAIVALALTLVASVRRRRHDLALLKALGFTRRQIAAAVAAQSTAAVVIGLVIGVPLGLLAGRELWDLFAHSLHVVPDPTMPVGALLFVVIGALVLANLVAAIPGAIAARTPTALLLNAE